MVATISLLQSVTPKIQQEIYGHMDSEPWNARDAVWHHSGTAVLDILAVERHAFCLLLLTFGHSLYRCKRP